MYLSYVILFGDNRSLRFLCDGFGWRTFYFVIERKKQMQECKSCGKEYEGNFCPYCGAGDLGGKCPRCGAALIADARFCAECGADVAEAAWQKKIAEEKRARQEQMEREARAERERQAQLQREEQARLEKEAAILAEKEARVRAYRAARNKKIAKHCVFWGCVLAVFIIILAVNANIFRAAKVSRIPLGASEADVIGLLGEPHEKDDEGDYSSGDTVWKYYSKNYRKLLDRYNADGDDIESEEDLEDAFEELGDMIEAAETMRYKYIEVSFRDGKVVAVYLDKDKCDGDDKDQKYYGVEKATLADPTFFVSMTGDAYVNVALCVKYENGSYARTAFSSDLIDAAVQEGWLYWTDDFGEHEMDTSFVPLPEGYYACIDKCDEYNRRYDVRKFEEALKYAEEGSVFAFGDYEQDNNASNGKEAIEWQVLKVENGKVLVISKYALDCKPYHTEGSTWENCSLRSWLNESFLNEAFTTGEQERILSATLPNPENPDYGTEGGNDTTDKIFLLSIDEANSYFASDSVRVCKPTAYAKVQGAYTDGEGGCWWWLRSPGINSRSAANVNFVGDVYAVGYNIYYDYCAVRPAFWIDLPGDTSQKPGSITVVTDPSDLSAGG